MLESIKSYEVIATCLKETVECDNTPTRHAYIEPDQNTLNGFYEALINSKLIVKQVEEYKICDIGFGLGTSLYNIQQQIKNFNIHDNKYSFHGIEINEQLVQLFNLYTKKYWSNVNIDIKRNINIIKNDLFRCMFDMYDLIYMYSPLRGDENISKGYDHILKSLKSDGLLYERYNLGRGINNILYDKVHKDKQFIIHELYFGGNKNLIIQKI